MLSIEEIRKHNIQKVASITRGFGGMFTDDFEKGKKVPVGTVSNGMKKVAEGKWEKVKGDGGSSSSASAATSKNSYSTDKTAFGEQIRRARKMFDTKEGDDKEKARKFLEGAKAHKQKMISSGKWTWNSN